MAKLSYICKGEGKVLLLLHGYKSRKECFNGQIEYFSRYFKVVAVDLTGFGETAPLERAYRLDDYIEDLIRFLDECKIERFSVIAHSFGARLMLKSDTLRARCDKLVLTGGAGLKPKRGLKYYFRVYWYKLLKKINPKSPRLKNFGSEEYKTLNEVEKLSYVYVVNEHLNYKLKDILNPTLIINGEQDRVTPKSSAKKLRKGIKNSKLIFIKDAGHFAFCQKTGEFNALVKEFLLAKR